MVFIHGLGTRVLRGKGDMSLGALFAVGNYSTMALLNMRDLPADS